MEVNKLNGGANVHLFLASVRSRKAVSKSVT